MDDTGRTLESIADQLDSLKDDVMLRLDALEQRVTQRLDALRLEFLEAAAKFPAEETLEDLSQALYGGVEPDEQHSVATQLAQLASLLREINNKLG